MKFQNMMLSLIGVVILTGCGVSQSEHQRVKNELQQTKQKPADASAELDAAKQKVASLNNSLAEQDKTIQGLNDSVKAAEASNAAKDAQIERLMNPEESAFADAQAADKIGDNTKTSAAYKAFVRDFPFSSKVALAQARIKEIDQIFAGQKKEVARQKAEVQQAYANGYNRGLASGQLWKNAQSVNGTIFSKDEVAYHFQQDYQTDLSKFYPNAPDELAQNFKLGYATGFTKTFNEASTLEGTQKMIDQEYNRTFFNH
jgi:uncharacterized coiled-coil protein SlyX